MSLPRFRVLSMDGGGIYGYTTARFLENLCAADPTFLTSGQRVKLFAGTSAGALNALLLATAADPRDFVVSKKLRNFWLEHGIFSNNENPVDAWLSLFGITAWMGTRDFRKVLENYFGTMTLGDVQSHVMLTAWDWNGSGPNPTWRPIVFSDRIVSQQGLSLVDIAFGAAAPPPLRAVYGGIGDGGYFAPNPSLYAYTFATNARNENFAHGESFTEFIGVSSSNIALLSVGTGNGSPSYFLKNFNFGAWPFGMLPTNPMAGNWYPPSIQLAVDAPAESETLLSDQIMGDFYHRLDPPILNPPWVPPVLVGTALARFWWWQQYLIAVQDYAIDHDSLVTPAIANAASFVTSSYWTDPPPSPSPSPSPPSPSPPPPAP